jgi:hypothetical protein
MRERLAWRLVAWSDHLWNRPRGAWLAFELQMVAHGLLGNGWGGVLMQLREDR